MRKPPQPCQPSRCDGVLLPRIIAHERRCIPRLCTSLCLKDLPDCAPLCLQSLLPSAQTPTWTLADSPDGCGRVHLRICIPVAAQLCDACGNRHCAQGAVEACVLLPHAFASLHRRRLYIEPQIQLLCAEAGCNPGCFDVQLHVSLEIYLLCMEAFAMRPPKPACPQLPLYPPPMR